MTKPTPLIGIDFGTTNSCVAWFDHDKGEAKVLTNAEGDDKTPSLVYFGRDQVLVGKAAEDVLKELEHAGEDERQEERLRLVRSVKRTLAAPTRIALPGGRRVAPVEVAAEIFRKLKRDAEDEHFREAVNEAVVTCPAVFDEGQREQIVEAATRAGFRRVDLIEEPVAAAIAFAGAYSKGERGVLVYDLGGGTFDLAVVVRDGEGFRVGLETDGDARCGGDDFDQALYDYWEAEALRDVGIGFGGAGGEVSLEFLTACRRRKESLSQKASLESRSLLSNGSSRKVSIDRRTFEELIREKIEQTIRLTKSLHARARDANIPVETVLLIGGSSRIPLVQRRLKEELGVEPLPWMNKDVAVALGAALYRHRPARPPQAAVPVPELPVEPPKVSAPAKAEERRRERKPYVPNLEGGWKAKGEKQEDKGKAMLDKFRTLVKRKDE